jgi:hypothetical protein
MYLVIDGKVLDDEFQLLEELGGLIDQRLEQIDRAIETCPDPDGWGYFDSADALCGLGFAAIQQYLASTAAFLGVDKSTALKCGPAHASGLTVAAGVNHAANWWKHCDEWRLGKSGKQEEITIRGVEALGVPIDGSYVLTVALAKLVSPKHLRFRELLPLVEEWRDDIRKRFPSKTDIGSGPGV